MDINVVSDQFASQLNVCSVVAVYVINVLLKHSLWVNTNFQSN